MSAGKYKLHIMQGSTFRKHFVWKTGEPPVVVNLTGWTARMQIREQIDAELFLVELTTENGGITLGGVLGTIDLLLTDAQTTLLTFDVAYYDIELIAPSGGDVTRLLQGMVINSKEVTR